MLEDESEDVLGLVVQAMKMFPVNEEVQLHGCGALQFLLETGRVGEVFQAKTSCFIWSAGPGCLRDRDTQGGGSSLEGEKPKIS